MATVKDARRRQKIQQSFYGYFQQSDCPECGLLPSKHEEYRDRKPTGRQLGVTCWDVWQHYESEHPEKRLPHQVFLVGWEIASSEPGKSIPAMQCVCGENLSPRSPHNWHGRAERHLVEMERVGELCLQRGYDD